MNPCLMNTLKITILLVLVLVSASPMLAVGEDAKATPLQEVREFGRKKSRFLQETIGDTLAIRAIPKANLSDFHNSVGSLLEKHCVACHGPQETKAQLRVDKLNPDLLTGSDIERWREVYGVLSNSEMPPEGEPDYELADADRRNVVAWLSDELNKASLVRRNTSEHSSFRRMEQPFFRSSPGRQRFGRWAQCPVAGGAVGRVAERNIIAPLTHYGDL